MTDAWPALPFEPWRQTCDTLHMWTQIVGKVRLALTPKMNHWWQVPLYVSARGLTTSAIPYRDGSFEIEFDFLDHVLAIRTSEVRPGRCRSNRNRSRPSTPSSWRRSHSLGIEVRIWTMPQEFADPIPFERIRCTPPTTASRSSASGARCVGRCGAEGVPLRLHRQVSPVHFFWGSFDLAVTRFSGRPRPADAAGRHGHAARPIRTRSAASAGGRATPTRRTPPSTPTPSPSRPGFGKAMVRPAAAFYDGGASASSA